MANRGNGVADVTIGEDVEHARALQRDRRVHPDDPAPRHWAGEEYAVGEIVEVDISRKVRCATYLGGPVDPDMRLPSTAGPLFLGRLSDCASSISIMSKRATAMQVHRRTADGEHRRAPPHFALRLRFCWLHGCSQVNPCRTTASKAARGRNTPSRRSEDSTGRAFQVSYFPEGYLSCLAIEP